MPCYYYEREKMTNIIMNVCPLLLLSVFFDYSFARCCCGVRKKKTRYYDNGMHVI